MMDDTCLARGDVRGVGTMRGVGLFPVEADWEDGGGCVGAGGGTGDGWGAKVCACADVRIGSEKVR